MLLRRFSNLFTFVVMYGFVVSSAFATDYTWIGPASSLWGADANWSPYGIPLKQTDTATIGDGVTQYTVTYNMTPVILGEANVNNATLNFSYYAPSFNTFNAQDSTIIVGRGVGFSAQNVSATDMIFTLNQTGSTTTSPCLLALTNGSLNNADITSVGGDAYFTNLTLTNINIAAENMDIAIAGSNFTTPLTGSFRDASTLILQNTDVILPGLPSFAFYDSTLDVYGGSVTSLGILRLYDSSSAEFRDTTLNLPTDISRGVHFSTGTVSFFGNTNATMGGIESGAGGTYYQNITGTINTENFMLSESGHAEFRGGTMNIVDMGLGYSSFQLLGTTLTVGGPTTWIISESYRDPNTDVNLFLHGHGFNPIKILDGPGSKEFRATSYDISDDGVGLMILNDKTITLMDVALNDTHVSNIKARMNLTDAKLFTYTNVTDTTGMKIQINEAAIPQTWDQEIEGIFYNDQALYGQKGSLKIDGDHGLLFVNFSGVNTSELSQRLYEFLDSNIAGSGLSLKETGTDGLFLLDGDFYSNEGYSYFGWDLAGFNLANSSNVMLHSLAIPEPATWIMMLTASVFTIGIYRRKRRNVNR